MLDLSYRYDVFVSVKWDDLFGAWVRDDFMPVFLPHLKNSVIAKCDRDFAGIFYYKDDISYGQNWKNRLKEAIPYSRCVIALCSPEYFRSRYCMLEWNSFSDRAQSVNADLIIPASIHDGQSFPQYARDIQVGELQDFVIPGSGFRLTAQYATFVARVRELADCVAARVQAAPEFQAWSIADEDALKPAEKPQIPQETL
jgi:hypothetical protein